MDSAFWIIPDRLIEIPLQLMFNFNPITLNISWSLLTILNVIIFSYIVYLCTDNTTKALIFSALFANINITALSEFGMVSHNGTMLICGFFIVIVMKYFLYNKGEYCIKSKLFTWIFYIFLIFLSVFSDPLIIIIFIIPITLSYIFFYEKKSIALNILFILVPIFSYLCYKYNTVIAKAIIPNPPFFHKYMQTMTPVDAIGDNILLLFKGIVWLLNENLKPILFGPTFSSICILLLLLLIGVYSLYYFSKEKNQRVIFLRWYLLTSIMALSGAYVMSGLAVDIWTTRYLIFAIAFLYAHFIIL